jgi:hypothetical protein
MSDVFENTTVDDDDTVVEPSTTTSDRYNLRKNYGRSVFNSEEPEPDQTGWICPGRC